MATVKSTNQTENFCGVRINKDTKKWTEKRKKELGFKKQKHYVAYLLHGDGLPSNPLGI